MNTLKDYQEWTIETAVYPEAGLKTDFELNYLIMGFVGEAGELANKYKKLLRNGALELGPNSALELKGGEVESLLDEAGDALWYLARILEVLDYDFIRLAARNQMKLSQRKDEGTLKNHTT